MLPKKAIRAINSDGYNAHTEPLFKLYNLLKGEDIYKFRLLVFYHNLIYDIGTIVTKWDLILFG